MAAYPPIPGYTQGTQIWTDQFNKSSYNVIGTTGFNAMTATDKASGRSLYTRDIILPGMLYAVTLTSRTPMRKLRPWIPPPPKPIPA